MPTQIQEDPPQPDNTEILIRFTREGKDAFEEVRKSTIAEWSQMTGRNTAVMYGVDCDDLADDDAFETIMSREAVDVTLSQLKAIAFVINMF